MENELTVCRHLQMLDGVVRVLFVFAAIFCIQLYIDFRNRRRRSPNVTTSPACTCGSKECGK